MHSLSLMIFCCNSSNCNILLNAIKKKKYQFAVQKFSPDTLDNVKFKSICESTGIRMQMELWKAKGKIFMRPLGSNKFV